MISISWLQRHAAVALLYRLMNTYRGRQRPVDPMLQHRDGLYAVLQTALGACGGSFWLRVLLVWISYLLSLSRGSASPSRCRCCRAPWEWGSRYRSPWSVCCSEQNSTCMHESMRTAVAKIAHKSSASGAMQQKAHFIRAGAERSTTI